MLRPKERSTAINPIDETTVQSQQKLPEAVKENIDLIADFYDQEGSKITRTQSVIEKISAFFSSPIYFSILILFVFGWIAINQFEPHFNIAPFDPEPFVLLHGIIGLNGILITIAVLVKQNRLEKLEEKRDHLNLQATLLAEKKTTKIIKLLEELRRDLPNVKNRVDPEIEDMKIDTDPHEVLSALDEQQAQK
jgi:uncharacterized membrane protein